MLLSKSNSDERTTRIVNLDFLRGLFVILALDQHFTYYINMWYVSYFRDAIALTTTYKVHFPMIGKQIATDYPNYILGLIFIPWVSQVYLTLASFNLAKRTQQKFKEGLFSKLKIFGLIYIFFVLENFIVAPNMGQAISFYPIMLWMVIMSILSIVYSFLGIHGILAITALSFFRWLLPVDMISDLFQNFMIQNIHPGYEYDARIEYFFTSGCLGFLMGYAHYHMPNLKKYKDFYFMGLGLMMVLIYVLWGEMYSLDPANAFFNEHELAQTFTGTFYVLGIQALVISFFLWLENKSIRFNIPIFNWVGLNSITVFALHRILFVKIIAPIVILLGSIIDRPIGASIYEMYFYVFLAIGISYLIKRSRMGELVLGKAG